MVDVVLTRMFGKAVGAVSWNPQYGIAAKNMIDKILPNMQLHI